MIKIMKWELLKELNILKWIIAPFLVFLIILLIIPYNANNKIDNGYDVFLGFSRFIILIIPAFFILFYPSISLVLELRQSYSVLEKSTPQPFAKILFVRIIINIVIVLIGIAIGFIGMKVINRFYIVQHFHAEYNLYLLSIAAIFYPLVIHFFYLLMSNFSPILGTIFLTTLFIKITSAFYFLSHTILVPIQILISIIAFVGSCLLYEKYYSPK